MFELLAITDVTVGTVKYAAGSVFYLDDPAAVRRLVQRGAARSTSQYAEPEMAAPSKENNPGNATAENQGTPHDSETKDYRQAASRRVYPRGKSTRR